MKLLPLADSPWSLAYTRIVLALKADPVLSTTINPGGWSTYIDEPDNADASGEDSLPAIQVLPFGLPASSESPISQYAPFGISICIACEGTDVRDLLNFWGAVHNAIFPGDGSRVLVSAIRGDFASAQSGAQLESIQLGTPAITADGPGRAAQQWKAAGTITLNMRVRK